MIQFAQTIFLCILIILHLECKKYVKEVNNSETQNIVTEYIVTDSVVNVRLDHTIESKVIGTVKFRDTVVGLDEYLAPRPEGYYQPITHPYWIKIKYKNTTGYVSGEYLAQKESCESIQEIFLLCLQQKVFQIPYYSHSLFNNYILIGEKSRWNLSYGEKYAGGYVDSLNSEIIFNSSFQTDHIIVTDVCGSIQSEGGNIGGNFCVSIFWKIKDKKVYELGTINRILSRGSAVPQYWDWSKYKNIVIPEEVIFERDGYVYIDKTNFKITFDGTLLLKVKESGNKQKVKKEDFKFELGLHEIDKYYDVLLKKERKFLNIYAEGLGYYE